jgi:hypothetical protein
VTINAANFYSQVIVPTLEVLENVAGMPLTAFKMCLNMATCAQEGALGTWLVQTGGDAISPYQFEPSSLDDVISNLTAPQSAALATMSWPSPAQPKDQIITNLRYACACCEFYYLQRNTITSPAPQDITIASLWAVYKPVWNTAAGAATEAEFTQNFGLTGIILPAQNSASALIMPDGRVFMGASS